MFASLSISLPIMDAVSASWQRVPPKVQLATFIIFLLILLAVTIRTTLARGFILLRVITLVLLGIFFGCFTIAATTLVMLTANREPLKTEWKVGIASIVAVGFGVPLVVVFTEAYREKHGENVKLPRRPILQQVRTVSDLSLLDAGDFLENAIRYR